MDQQEIAKFREEFKKIAWLRGEVTEVETRIKMMTRWDKNGSHENALQNALQRRDEIKKDINAMLKGRNYDDWKLLSKKITIITGRVKRAKETLEKSELELSRLAFDPTRDKSA